MPDRFRHTKTIHIVLLILLALLSSCSPGVKKTEKELLVVNLSPESVQVHLTSDQGEDYTLCLEGYSSLPLTVPYGTKNLIVTPVGTYFQGSFTHSFLSLEPLWLEPVEPVVRNGERDPEGIFHSINHRGYNTVAPENTLSAFRLSKEKGFTQVETDVAFTLDGVPVLLHDSTIDR
ncbi:MAG: hypothetical protein KBS81_03020, partial [Spirochaetales bacterium]|nr:hypothetical protein [Candidatus Physcosoma equi]